MPSDIQSEELDRLIAYWEAANYLTVAQIYLQDNPLLREPLRAEHIKPRLLGHWGTSPGLNLVYAQLNRLIRFTGDGVDLDALANESPVGDCRLSGQRAAVPAVLVRSREDVEIGAQTRATLGLR